MPADPVELVIFDCDGVLIDSERMAAKPAACVVVEDSRPGVEAARAGLLEQAS